ncbi:hypothetical protein ACN47E_003218 [Coniothyrium glycines]
MVARKDPSVGNILLYEYLATKRTPIFLQRNLIRFLRTNQHILSGGNAEDFPEDNYISRRHWNPPSRDLLCQMVERANLQGSFVLDLQKLVPLTKLNPVKASLVQSHTKRARQALLAHCRIKITVHRNDGQKVFGPANFEATLHGEPRTREVTFAMERITISHDELFTTAASKCRLSLTLNFASESDAKDVYAYMGLDKVLSCLTRLEAKQGNIIDMAYAKATLRLVDHANDPILGLDVAMGRAETPKESILESYSRHTRSFRHAQASTAPLDTLFRVTYVWRHDNDRQQEVRGLSCHQNRCGRTVRNTKELMMHLRNTHYMHEYVCGKEELDENGLCHYTITCTLLNADTTHRASDRTDDPRDYLVEAPDEIFDLDKSLRGDLSWENTARQSQHLRPPNLRAKTNQKRGPPSGPRRKLPGAVVARPTNDRRTYIVPEAPPNVVFFRSVTKQPLMAGDAISESDDELDEAWLQQRKCAEIEQEHVSEDTKQFLKAFDIFIGNENLESDVHLGDSVVRFAREHAILLRDAAVFENFQKKLESLSADNIISREVKDGCVDIVRSNEPVPRSLRLSQSLPDLQVRASGSSISSTQRRIARPHKDRKGKAKALQCTDVEQKLSMEAVDPPFDQCYCGEDALSSCSLPNSPAISCSSIHCIRRTFHVVCIEKQTGSSLDQSSYRQRTWTCDDCKGVSTIGS